MHVLRSLSWVAAVTGAILLAGPAGAREPQTPWWKRQKIRFMWGQWPHADHVATAVQAVT